MQPVPERLQDKGMSKYPSASYGFSQDYPAKGFVNKVRKKCSKSDPFKIYRIIFPGISDSAK
jgi:hypothetical protein